MIVEHLINETYQVIDEATDLVVYQGTHEDCQLVMYAEEEARLREEFLLMMS